MITFLYALHFIVCFVLIGVVLLQRGKGADLGASLGGGSANTIFGSRGAGEEKDQDECAGELHGAAPRRGSLAPMLVDRTSPGSST